MSFLHRRQRRGNLDEDDKSYCCSDLIISLYRRIMAGKIYCSTRLNLASRSFKIDPRVVNTFIKIKRSSLFLFEEWNKKWIKSQGKVLRGGGFKKKKGNLARSILRAKLISLCGPTHKEGEGALELIDQVVNSLWTVETTNKHLLPFPTTLFLYLQRYCISNWQWSSAPSAQLQKGKDKLFSFTRPCSLCLRSLNKRLSSLSSSSKWIPSWILKLRIPTFFFHRPILWLLFGLCRMSALSLCSCSRKRTRINVVPFLLNCNCLKRPRRQRRGVACKTTFISERRVSTPTTTTSISISF